MEKQENKQKIKLLLIMEFLKKTTSADAPVTTRDMCDKLMEQGIKCDRRTLYQDIELLEEYGFPVAKKHVGHAMGYYYDSARLSEIELRFLTDAVEAAGFLPREQADALEEKLAVIGKQMGLALTKEPLHFNETLRTDADVFKNVEIIGNAVLGNNRLGFRYYDLDENREKVFRKLGRRYLVDPVAVIYNESNFYLTVYNEKYDAFNIYRVDRMTDIDILDEPIAGKALTMRENVSAYTTQMFRMFGGETEEVSLRFPDKLLGPVYDKFGLDINVTRLDSNVLEAECTVQLSPPFYGWVFQFGGEMRITGPGKAVKGYRKALKKALPGVEDTDD